MPLPKPPIRPGDTVETAARTATPEPAPVLAVPGPALDPSLDAPRARGAKTRPVAAILTKPPAGRAAQAPAAAPVSAPAAKASPAPATQAPVADQP
ncbi:MAG: hypothetical protein WBH02_10325, partial [Castellaniella sp.]